METGELSISLSLVIALVVLGLIELGLLVFALVSLIRRPVAGVRGRTKLPWALIIILVSWIGPLLYFALGRVDIPLDESGQRGDGGPPPVQRAEDTIDLLYEQKDQQ
jgi:hypothetical protein